MNFTDLIDRYVPGIKYNPEDDSYKFMISSLLGYSTYNDDKASIILTADVIDYFRTIFEDASLLNIHDVSLKTPDYFEVGLYQDSLERRKSFYVSRRSLTIEAHAVDLDSKHKIEYTIDKPSLEFVFSILKTIDHIGDDSKIAAKLHIEKRELYRLKRNSSFIQRLTLESFADSDSGETSFTELEPLSPDELAEVILQHEKEILTNIFSGILEPIKTLRIKRDSSKIRVDDRELAASFLYVRGRANAPIYRLTSNLTSVLTRGTINVRRKTQVEIEPPRKLFKVELIEMYLNARQTLDDYGAFLGYYHILEFFFSEAFKIEIGKQIQNVITRPDFSYTDIGKIYAMAKKSSKLINDSKHGDAGNESDSLKYVLKEYVHQDDLDSLVFDIEEDFANLGLRQYDKKYSTDFSKMTIDFSSLDRFCATARDRIYKVRNSLVHAKSGSRRYNAKQDQEQLHIELYLIEKLAEIVINNSADVLQ